MEVVTRTTRATAVCTVVGLLALLGACTTEPEEGGGARGTNPATPPTLGEPTAASSVEPSYFFSQNARSGTYTTTADGVQLVLDDVADMTVAIMERPNRGATHLRTGQFVDEWADQFGDDPPNATISVIGADGTQYEAALELLGPTYDAESRRLTYPARVLTGSLPDTFTDASVMIDDASLTVQLTIVDQSADDAEFVLYRPNVFAASGTDLAWTVLGPGGSVDGRTVELGALSVSATDSFGEQIPQLSAAPGSAFTVSLGAGGVSLTASTPTYTHPDAITVQNGLQDGSMNASVYEGDKLLSTVTGVQPANQAIFRFATSIWIAAATGVVQGAVVDPSALQDATELSLEGVTAADVVITGGGSQPYVFTLSNVQS